MITITDAAREKILDVLYDYGRPNAALRVYVQGGGCSGFQYGFKIDEEINEDDFEFEVKPFRILIDSISMQYMQGSVLDYHDELMRNGFAIDNPNATGQCGCGSSFTV